MGGVCRGPGGGGACRGGSVVSISSQEELKHFEVKIEKHNHYQKQLEISHQKLKHVESFGDQEHVTRNRERYATLEERTKELGYKVGVRRLLPRHSPHAGASDTRSGPRPCPGLHSPGGVGAGLWGRGLPGLPSAPPPRLRAPHQVTSKSFGAAAPTGGGGQAGRSRALPAAQLGRVARPGPE